MRTHPSATGLSGRQAQLRSAGLPWCFSVEEAEATAGPSGRNWSQGGATAAASDAAKATRERENGLLSLVNRGTSGASIG